MERAGMGAAARRAADRVTGRQLGTVALLCLLGVACRAPTMLAPATPSTPGWAVRALVLGRVQVSINGRPVRVGPQGRGARIRGSGYDQAAPVLAEGSLTMLVFRSTQGGGEFRFDVPDDTGGLEVLLPPGRYEIRLRYDDWLLGTPVVLDAPAAGERYYVGTLRADLFRRRSLRGWWARAFGGSVPQRDNDFAITDDWEWARQHLGAFSAQPASVQKRLMTVGSSR
jgi:hypothetical protein